VDSDHIDAHPERDPDPALEPVPEVSGQGHSGAAVKRQWAPTAGRAGEESVAEESAYQTSAYSYALPADRIATRPPAQRDTARLLVLRSDGGLGDATFADIHKFLRPGDCLVLNETRVIKARLYGVRTGSGGGRVELLLVGERDGGVWEALGRPGKRLAPGTALRLAGGAIEGEVVAVSPSGRRLIRLNAERPIPQILEQVGRVPIPPYLGREDDARDADDYQTVYARVPGAVAAPTAGLHFTPELLARIEASGVAIARLVLHPGPGTFRPLQVDDIRQHALDPEAFVLDEAAAARINSARAGGGRIVGVGTTVVRGLETQARRVPEADRGRGLTVIAGEGATDLFIHPPFRFLAVDALITNFHLPRSTLLMLVCAFAGRERVLGAYAEAIRRGYRFFSYGDAMLIE
jgi:S-adenosylmethionine:tRNA ribosyltransferase-isomerase